MFSFRRLLSSAVATAALLVLAGVTQASITGSAHDFGALGATGFAKGDTCLPCHTPHGAMVKDASGAVLAGPLWNHTLSTATYTLYLDSSGAGVTGEVDQNSKLCLSCHDGTVALDSFGGKTGTQFITNAKMITGTDLSNDHPIGATAVWWTTTPTYMVDPSLRVGTMPLRPMSDGKLAVGCTSCHEPHNRRNTDNMLWFANNIPGTTVDGRSVNGSLLCQNCHKK